MSVTFTIDGIRYDLCACGHAWDAHRQTGRPDDTREVCHVEGCACADYDLDPRGMVNVHNGNACEILDRLGIEHRNDGTDLYGEILAHDLVIACGEALHGLDAKLDVGLPGEERIGPNGARYIRPARPAGHINMRLRELQDLAERALRELGPLAKVRWS